MSCAVFAVPSPLALSPLMGNLTSRVAAPPLHGSEAIDFAVLTRSPLPPMQRSGAVGDPFERAERTERADRSYDSNYSSARHNRHSVYMDMGIHERTAPKKNSKKQTPDAPRRQRPSSVMMLSSLLNKGDSTAASTATSPTAPKQKKRMSWSLAKMAAEPTAYSPTTDSKGFSKITASETCSSMTSASTATTTDGPATPTPDRRQSWYAKLSSGGRRLRNKSILP